LAPIPSPLWRHLFHATVGSVLPLAGLFAPKDGMLLATGILTAVSLTLELARFRYSPLNRLLVHWLSPLLKEGEDRHLTGSTYLLIASFIAFLFFDRSVAVSALLFLALGDPAAAWVGKRMPGLRVWGKSPGGTAAFVAVALVTVAVLVGARVVPYHWSLLVGAGVAGLVELAPLRLDDNLTIPLLSGAAMHLMAL